ncbi:MAG: 1-aminocyclopropane-1-carboxylate deaminase/D-cysteine desulfhydrase [Halioglobus sp.]
MTHPLFDQYPQLSNAIPTEALLEAPTPVSQFSDNLWIKHDDQTSKVYGGNKVRKLEFVLAAAKANGKRKVVTFGALGTNHGVATATFCNQLGIDCQIYLFDQPVTPTVKTNLKHMVANGAQLIHTGSLANTVLRFYGAQALNLRDCFLPAGGSSPLGCVGFVNAAFELKQQIESGLLPKPDYIVCAVGSSGMLAGLTLGCALAGLETQVKGIRVAPSHLGPVPICTTGSVTALMSRTVKLLQQYVPDLAGSTDLQNLPVNLSSAFFGDGYGVASHAGDQAMAAMAKKGVALDATYTAKAAAAALQLREREPHSQVLYWHTFNAANPDISITEPQLRRQPKRVAAIISEKE